MSNVLLVIGIAVAVTFMVRLVQRRRHGLVAERGMSVGADLGSLGDQPRVYVRSVTSDGADRVRLVLAPEMEEEAAFDLEFVVELHEDDFAFGVLHEWKRSQSPIAIVMPPGSRLLRLRSTEDLQPMTLRRVDV